MLGCLSLARDISCAVLISKGVLYDVLVSLRCRRSGSTPATSGSWWLVVVGGTDCSAGLCRMCQYLSVCVIGRVLSSSRCGCDFFSLRESRW